VAADSHHEVRRVGLAVDVDAFELSAVAAVRAQDAGDALEDAQVRVLEGEGPVEWRKTRNDLVPGTE
jgi:hypothetical protein